MRSFTRTMTSSGMAGFRLQAESSAEPTRSGMTMQRRSIERASECSTCDHRAVAIARPLEELTQADAGLFGGKAVQCGVLLQAGFAVPEGIGVAFEPGEAAHVPPPVRDWLDARPAMRFAVRSSATDEDGAGSSFAGIHESVLDVDAEGIESAIA